MILYEFACTHCGNIFTEMCDMDNRDLPTKFPCPLCLKYRVRRSFSIGGFSVPEGAVGNAANGYSSTHGDAENFKAKSRGEKPPYEGVERIKDI